MEDHLQQMNAFVDRIRDLRDTIIANIVLIGQTPAPTFREKRRAKVFMDRLADSQVDECTTDGYRNAIGIIRGTSRDKPPIFLTAHLDTFFDKDIVYNYRVREDTITGPGILDNSLGVAVLASMPEILRALELQFESDIVLAGTIQSIGKANLRGVRHLVKNWATPIRGAICIEGIEIGRLNYYCDGMMRAEVACSFTEDLGLTYRFRPNAILVLNELINEILKLRLPQRPRSNIIIGLISGGVSHGKNPYQARLGFEIHSHSDRMVQAIFNDIKEIVDGLRNENEADLTLKTLSNLNAARLPYNHPLVKSAVAVLKALAIKPISKPTESALSIFLDKRIPALTLGISRGENFFQENARMAIEPMFKGIAQIIGVLQAIDRGVCDE